MKLKRNHIHLISAFLVTFTFFLGGCSSFGSTAASETDALPPVNERTANILVEGRITPKEDASLFFTNSGEIVELLAKEGDLVKKGDVLARLGDREAFEAQITSAQLELLSAQQAMSDLQTGAPLASGQARAELNTAQRAYTDADEALSEIDTDEYQNRLDDARAAVSEAQDELDDAQDEFDKYKDLDKDHPNRKRAEDALETAQDKYDQAVRDRDRLENDLDQAQADFQLAQANLDDALRNHDARIAGPDPDEFALAQARLDNATAQLSAAQANLNKLDLLAPFDGTIVRVDISVGERVLPNQAVMLIADFSAWHIETNDLTEIEVVSISTGQTARIIPDALHDVEMSASVDKISDYYLEKSGDITYQVRLILNEPDPRLRWGMTVEVTFDRSSP